MDSHTGPLLLLVQANIAPEHEEALNRWYYHHVPRLLEIPGWLWGRRYVGVKGATKYLALYGVENMDAIPGKTDVVSNVYEQVSGTHLGHPLLSQDHYLSVVMADCNDPAKEAEWNAWYDHSHVPNLTRVPGYLSGARFRVKTDPRFGTKAMGPKYLALYEWEGAHCLPALAESETMCAEAKAELAEWNAYGAKLAANMAWNVYRPIASHTSFR